MGAECELRIAQRKAGPVVTDQGNLVLDARFPGGIGDGAELERQLNSIPGVVETACLSIWWTRYWLEKPRSRAFTCARWRPLMASNSSCR